LADQLFPFQDPQNSVEDRIHDLISRMTLEEKVSQMVHDAAAIPRLNVPAYNWWSECLHGVARAGKATIFPQAIGLGATFDENLLHRIADAISDEARAMYHAAVEKGNRLRYAGLTFWSPNINIFRDPRWGRGQETYGEDPILTARLGVQFVKGLQGNHPEFLKVAACAKHYAVHSGPEGDRHHFNATTNKKDLFETYLPAFEALVKADVEAIMCAYNRTNGEACCANKELIGTILRKKWQFKGHVVSDCWALQDFHKHHNVTGDPVESAALSLNRGVNLNCGDTFLHLVEAVKEGLVDENSIDESLTILLKTRFKLGIFDENESKNPYSKIPVEIVGCKEHQNLAREAAQKSVVLLKNKNNVLPLSKDTPFIYMVGPGTLNSDVLIGNYFGISDRLVTLGEGVAAKLNPGTILQYNPGCLLDRENINPLDWATEATSEADVILAFMGISGLLEGEEGESIASPTKGDRQDIGLPPNQIDFLKKIRENHDKPLVVVLTGGSPMDLYEIEKIADAILFIWYPGQEGGNAVADILFGDNSPSGRLPVTFPRSLDQLPPYEEYSMENRTYRYMEAQPLYPFGYGLSYTTFLYQDIKLSAERIKPGQKLTVSARITNTGTVESEEVVQLYISDIESAFRVPKYQLKDFKRILLKPGESTILEFEINDDLLYLVNNEGERILEKGSFRAYISPACPINRSTELGLNPPIFAEFILE